MKDITEEVLGFMYPDVEILMEKPNTDYITNNIKRCQVLIFGAEGTGKTRLVDYLTEIALKKYGNDNVSAYVSDDIDILMEKGIEDRLINILFIDDITRKEIRKESIMNYFRLRHKVFNRFKRSQGLVLSILGIHRFHGTIPDIRTNLDVLILRSAPLNPYDRSVIRRFVTDEGIKLLNEWDIQRRKGLNKYWNYSMVYMRGQIGIFKSKLPSKLYLTELKSKPLGYKNTQYTKDEYELIKRIFGYVLFKENRRTVKVV